MTHTLKTGELFLAGDRLSLGINAYGTLGTAGNAPADVPVGEGFTRLGLHVAGLDKEVMLPGTPLQGWLASYHIGGQAVTLNNCARAGFRSVAGYLVDASIPGQLAGEWRGRPGLTPDIEITRTHKLAPDGQFVEVATTWRNLSSSPLTDLRFNEVFDFDHGPSFETRNDVNASLVVCLRPGSGDWPAFLYSPVAKASALAGYRITNPALPALYEGKAAQGDSFAALAWEPRDLAPGASVTFTAYFGVTNDLDATLAMIRGEATTPPAVTPPAEAPDVTGDVVWPTALHKPEKTTAKLSTASTIKALNAANPGAGLKSGMVLTFVGQNRAGQYVYRKNA